MNIIACMALLVALCIPSAVGADPKIKNRCKSNPHLVGECFKVHGRLSWTNGSSAKFWRVGSKRLLGVPCWDDACMPDYIYEKLGADVDVFGDYEVCPLTKEEPEVMRMVCIESASNLVLKRYPEPKQAP